MSSLLSLYTKNCKLSLFGILNVLFLTFYFCLLGISRKNNSHHISSLHVFFLLVTICSTVIVCLWIPRPFHSTCQTWILQDHLTNMLSVLWMSEAQLQYVNHCCLDCWKWFKISGFRKLCLIRFIQSGTDLCVVIPFH